MSPRPARILGTWWPRNLETLGCASPGHRGARHGSAWDRGGRHHHTGSGVPRSAGSAAEGQPAVQRTLRNRLQWDLRRGTVTCVDTLARSMRGLVDEVLPVAFRVAADQRVKRAMDHHDLLREIMRSEAGSLDGMAVARRPGDHTRVGSRAIRCRDGSRAGQATAPPPQQGLDCLQPDDLAHGQTQPAACETALAQIDKRGPTQAELGLLEQVPLGLRIATPQFSGSRSLRASQRQIVASQDRP